MKNFYYLLAFTLMFVNTSCSFLAGLAGNNLCNCTCSECIKCEHKVGHLPTVHYQKQDSTQQVANSDPELDSLLNLDFSIVHYEVPEDPTPKARIPYYWDENEEVDVQLDSLKRLFKVTKNGDITEYVHKGINTAISNNDIYFYITEKNGVLEPLRFVVHYYADDSIEFESLKFNLDGFKYEYKPTNIKRETEGKFFIERFDNAFNAKSRDIASALSKCRYVGGASNVLLHSKKGVSHRIYLTKDQVKHFLDTYNLYRKMGGTL